jgi:hypothetical protein
MLIDAHGRYGKTLKLGVQTNKGNVNKHALWLAKLWSPKGTKSFSFSITHTDYNGIPTTEETGYANMIVSYYSTKKEGENKS